MISRRSILAAGAGILGSALVPRIASAATPPNRQRHRSANALSVARARRLREERRRLEPDDLRGCRSPESADGRSGEGLPAALLELESHSRSTRAIAQAPPKRSRSRGRLARPA